MPGCSDRSIAPVLGLILPVLALSWAPLPARSQVISPGKLSESHASLEGMGNCTRCHQLRARGVDAARCLDCHEPLAARIREASGYHGRMEARKCGTCHKEHLGKSFRVIHFDPAAFQHDSTGYELRGRHAQEPCAACHRAELVRDETVRAFKGPAGALNRTYLGLGTECESCHGQETPHGDQFAGRSCADCHDEGGWEGAGKFSHETAGYRLDGRHVGLDCAKCHKQGQGGGAGTLVLYRPVDAGDCRSCHATPHRAGLVGRCDGCHATSGWGEVSRGRIESSFDHATTLFPLEGAHLTAPCAACHDPGSRGDGIVLRFGSALERTRTYPRPVFDGCASCHADPHRGEEEGRGCDQCHGAETWTPATFSLARHDLESDVLLAGAHRVTPCGACHLSSGSGERVFRLKLGGPGDCRSCHRERDPHQGAFGQTACDLCHSEDAFTIDAFDHLRPELGEWIQGCRSCHQTVQPHGDQFGDRECGECHATDTFRNADFDHSGARFRLDGEHAGLSCAACHPVERVASGGVMVRYAPLPTDCAACHEPLPRRPGSP